MTLGEHVFVATTVVFGLIAGIMTAWFFWTRRYRDCFHHDPKSGQSWIYDRLIDLGRRKMFTCTHCYQRWFTP